MCNPIALAGAALTVGSTVANTVAQNKIQAARDNAMAAERIRQSGLDKEADALNTQSQDRYQDFEGQQDDRAAELGQYFTDQQIEASDANAAATRESTIPQSGSNVTIQEEAKQRGQAREFADEQGMALGNLRSFGDLLGEVGRGQARDASQIGQIGGFKRGSSNVLPFELEAANSAGGGAQLFGDILGLGGSVALSKGIGGGAATADPWSGLREVGPTGGSGLNTFIRGGPGGATNLYSLYR